jgi:glycosyltransferase involved in cell wall biosynthesis
MICGTPPLIEGVHVEFRKWDHGTEVADLQTGHIGIMPLPDDEWTRGKCGLKLLQYMSMGMASIASPVGVNREIIQDGVNGFLASTHDEWYEKLLRLCEEAPLRTRIGQEARKTVIESYSLSVWAPRLIACYRSLSDPMHHRNTSESLPKTA